MTTPLLKQLDDLRPELEELCRRLSVQLFLLFGSQARGDALPFSDIDFAVLLSEMSTGRDETQRHVELATELMRLIHRDDIQVVLLQGASPLLKHRAATEGIVLYEDPGAHANFLIKALQQYDDTRSLREAEAQSLRQRHARR